MCFFDFVVYQMSANEKREDQNKKIFIYYHNYWQVIDSVLVSGPCGWWMSASVFALRWPTVPFVRAADLAPERRDQTRCKSIIHPAIFSHYCKLLLYTESPRRSLQEQAAQNVAVIIESIKISTLKLELTWVGGNSLEACCVCSLLSS